jgi:hypothetical protein
MVLHLRRAMGGTTSTHPLLGDELRALREVFWRPHFLFSCIVAVQHKIGMCAAGQNLAVSASVLFAKFAATASSLR